MSDVYGGMALATAVGADEGCALVFADEGGTIRSWNRGAELLFGHAAKEAIGRRVDLIVPAALREAHWAGFDRAVCSPWSGSSSWGPIEPLHKDGRLLALEVFLTGVNLGTPTSCGGILALFRPPSDRQAEV